MKQANSKMQKEMNTTNPERSWVWSSTDASIEKGQISILAIAEIPVAMVFFYWVSTISPWPWATWIGLMAVPLLLLKSPESVSQSHFLIGGFKYEVQRSSKQGG